MVKVRTKALPWKPFRNCRNKQQGTHALCWRTGTPLCWSCSAQKDRFFWIQVERWPRMFSTTAALTNGSSSWENSSALSTGNRAAASSVPARWGLSLPITYKPWCALVRASQRNTPPKLQENLRNHPCTASYQCSFSCREGAGTTRRLEHSISTHSTTARYHALWQLLP